MKRGHTFPNATVAELETFRAGFLARGGINGPRRKRDTTWREFPEGVEPHRVRLPGRGKPGGVMPVED